MQCEMWQVKAQAMRHVAGEGACNARCGRGRRMQCEEMWQVKANAMRDVAGEGACNATCGRGSKAHAMRDVAGERALRTYGVTEAVTIVTRLPT